MPFLDRGPTQTQPKCSNREGGFNSQRLFEQTLLPPGFLKGRTKKKFFRKFSLTGAHPPIHFLQIEIFLLLWLIFGFKGASIIFSTPVEQRQTLPKILMMTVVVMLMMI